MAYRNTNIKQDEEIYGYWSEGQSYDMIAAEIGITREDAEKGRRRHHQRMQKSCPDRLKKKEAVYIPPSQRMTRIATITGIWADMTTKPYTERTFILK